MWQPGSQELQRSRFASISTYLLLTASLLLAASGCGGGGGSALIAPRPVGSVTAPSVGRGQVRFTIKWPEKATTRLIPQAAQSIKFICKDADDEDELITEQVIPRGQTVVTLDLPSVHVRIDAEARSVADGSGQVLAKGGVSVKVQEAKVTAEKLTLDSVITQVKLTPSEADLPFDQGLEVSADALDATGAVVLTAPENWEWTPEGSAGEITPFQSTGSRLFLRARKDGTAIFVVKEKETGHTARLTVSSHGQQEPPPWPETGEPGYFVYPALTNIKAGDIFNPTVYWRAPNGVVSYAPSQYFGRDPGGVWEALEGSNLNPKPLLALKQGETTIPAYINGVIFHVPVKVSGYLLSVTVPPGANGEPRAVEVSIDDRMVLKANQEGNVLGTRYDRNTSTIPIPMHLTPGQHKLTVKDVSEDASPDYDLAFKAGIVNIHDFNASVEKNGSTSEFFTIP